MEDIRYPGEPVRIGQQELDDILIWAVRNDASDIIFRSGDPVWIKRHGRRIRVTNRALTTPEIGGIINSIYGDNGTARISGGGDADTSHTVREGRDISHRFRFNGTGTLHNGNNGYSVTLRSISSMPPTIAEIGFPLYLVEAMSKSQGMVIITGETGSGKSTLQAAVLRHRVEQEDANLNVLTYESPVEFVFDDVIKPTSLVQQCEIPRSLPTFEAGIRNAMRRDPDIILIGESRDMVTMKASIDAAKSGHLLMTTMHSNGVASTVRRAVGMSPEGERNGNAIDIVESLNIILTQRLLRTVDGKRMPVREYLIFDEHIKNKMLSAPLDTWPAVARQLTKEYGLVMSDDARRLYKEGLISERELKLVAAQEYSNDEDSKIALSVDTGVQLGGAGFFNAFDNFAEEASNVA